MNSPKSCDTFAVLPPGTEGNCVIFGKNSDRPSGEVQEVVYVPASDYPVPSKLKCTYIEIDQVPHTYATILSKPSWMWGAEMGANEHNVCIGNEAVWTKLNDETDALEKLLGMDLLRLGLERAKTALEAVYIIVSLIEKYGMGGNCSDTIEDFTYHNSFLIADPEEVWILECANTIWAAEIITNGVRNISNELSIGTKMDLKCEYLEEFAKEKNFWSEAQGPLNFKLTFGLEEDKFESHRYKCGKKLLLLFSKNGQFKETDMFNVLRDKKSGICMSLGSFVSIGSQVSVLRKPESGRPSVHWFTATPDPLHSFFKPFIFTDAIEYPSEVISPVCAKDVSHGRFDRSHVLYHMQQQLVSKSILGSDVWRSKIKDVETKYIQFVKDLSKKSDPENIKTNKLFKMAVEEEIDWYINHGIPKPSNLEKT